MNEKYKIGTYVLIKKIKNGSYSAVEEMIKYEGKKTKIKKIEHIQRDNRLDRGYRLKIDRGSWWWDEHYLEKCASDNEQLDSYPKHFTPIDGYEM